MGCRIKGQSGNHNSLIKVLVVLCKDSLNSVFDSRESDQTVWIYRQIFVFLQIYFHVE